MGRLDCAQSRAGSLVPETVDATDVRTAVDELPQPAASVPQDEAEFACNLVAKILRGDRAAEAELMNHYERGMRRVLRRMDLNEEDRKELMHDTWETALEKIRTGKLHEHAVLGAFICGIAHWKAKNRVRSIRNHPMTSDPTVTDDLLSEGDEPDRATSHIQNAELVWQVLEHMRRRDRDMLIHFVLRDEDKDDVCAQLGISPVRFHGVLCRARQRFKKLLLKTTAGKEMERRR